MKEYVSIRQVAEALGVSYYVARNRLNRNPKCEELKVKFDYSVVYKKEVLKILGAE